MRLMSQDFEFPLDLQNSKLTLKGEQQQEGSSDYSYGKFLKIKYANILLTELYLCNNDMKELPVEILRFKCLVKLDLSFNRLVELPASLFQKSLQCLNLNSNQLTTLPNSIMKSRLEKLLLFKNNLTEFKKEWILHNQLIELDISENFITNLPAELFLVLQKIKIFRISGNPISQLPSSFNYLKQNLVEFHCSNCQMKKFPSVVSFESLQLMDVSNNNISHISSTKNLKWLSLKGNPLQITELPDDSCLVIDGK
eukprot:NODE_200_length_15202_cov_0.356618.p6 type:complete len:254 gc:universal NODE_200_length_15202_cov_0.356618:11581-10820(-)